MSSSLRLPPVLLIFGDVIAILVVTWIGFATHGISTASPRWLTTFLPMLVSWTLLSPWIGVYHPDYYCELKQTWRAPLAVFFAAPLAAVLRGAWLGTPVIVVFVLVLAGTGALGIWVWRVIWALVCRWTGKYG